MNICPTHESTPPHEVHSLGLPSSKIYKSAPDHFRSAGGVLKMGTRQYQVFVETTDGRTGAGFSMRGNAAPVDVSLLLRERGWTAYRIRADHMAFAWIATVMDLQRAA